MTAHTDLRNTVIADLAKYPGTIDKDRYARNVRSQVINLKALVEGNTDDILSELWNLVLAGLLRSVSREDEIAVTQRKLVVALDSMTVLAPGAVQWRTDVEGSATTPVSLKFGHNPFRDGRDFDKCICEVGEPETVCWASVHNV